MLLEKLAFKQDLRSWRYSCAAQLSVARALWSCCDHESSSSPVLESQLFCPFFLSAVLQQGDVWGVLTQLTFGKGAGEHFLVETRSFSCAPDPPGQTGNRWQEESSLGMSQVTLLVVWGLDELQDLSQFWTFIMRCKIWGKSSQGS